MLGNIPNMETHEIFLLKRDKRDKAEFFAFSFIIHTPAIPVPETIWICNINITMFITWYMLKLQLDSFFFRFFLECDYLQIPVTSELSPHCPLKGRREWESLLLWQRARSVPVAGSVPGWHALLALLAISLSISSNWKSTQRSLIWLLFSPHWLLGFSPVCTFYPENT